MSDPATSPSDLNLQRDLVTRMSRPFLRGFFALVMLEGLFSVWLLLQIPVDPSHVWLLGYSRPRLVMVSGMVAGALGFLVLTVKSVWGAAWLDRLIQCIQRLLSRDLFWVFATLVLLFICVTGGLFLTLPQDRAEDLMGSAYHQRFSPLVFWIAITCTQAILVSLVLRNGLAWQRWREMFLFLLLGLGIWLPRGLALDRYVTVDEPTWITRSANFLFALNRGDFANTYQREHPGVTTMWSGTAGLLWRFQELGSHPV